ncbi:MAG: hypothetical protein ABDH28_03095 [Brevinematia bacterium]
MIFAKLLLSILLTVTSFVSYLYLLRVLAGLKFSSTINIIILATVGIFLLLLIIVSIYISRIRRYDISRLDTKDIESISRFLNFVPFFFVIVSILFVFSVSAYEYRVSKDLAKFLTLVSFCLPVIFISYYSVKAVIYDIRGLGFNVFRRSRFISIFLSFMLVVFLNVAIGIPLIVYSTLYAKQSQLFVIYVVVLSFLLSLVLFMWSLALRVRHVINVLKAPEVFEKYVPVFSNDELGLFSVYLDTFIQRQKETSGFPEVYVGDSKVRVELGKQFCGCVWVRLFDIQGMFFEFSEKIMDDIQLVFSRIESKVIETRGYIARFDGTEMIIVWGLDGKDWVENLRSFLFSIYTLYRDNLLESIRTFKVGVAGGRVFVGSVEGINGNTPYFFGESIVESLVVGKYPRGEGIFVSGDFKDVFGKTEFVDRVKVKDINKIVEIYRLLI